MGTLLYKDITYKLNGICFQTHNALGRYANEKQYCDFIETLLKKEGVRYEREKILSPSFAGEKTGRNRVDFFIEDTVILEVKSKRALERADYVQLMRYLIALNKKLGVLVNFWESILRPKRVLNPKSNELPPNAQLRVAIKRIDPLLPLPQYQSDGSVAFDVSSRIDMIIPPKSIGRIPTNLIIQTPNEYALILTARSSTPQKKGLLVPHGIGIIDQDYCGPQDEILLQVYNFTDEHVSVLRGERIGQATFVRIDRAQWHEVDQIEKANRSGFGSTDISSV